MENSLWVSDERLKIIERRVEKGVGVLYVLVAIKKVGSDLCKIDRYKQPRKES